MVIHWAQFFFETVSVFFPGFWRMSSLFSFDVFLLVSLVLDAHETPQIVMTAQRCTSRIIAKVWDLRVFQEFLSIETILFDISRRLRQKFSDLVFPSNLWLLKSRGNILSSHHPIILCCVIVFLCFAFSSLSLLSNGWGWVTGNRGSELRRVEQASHRSHLAIFAYNFAFFGAFWFDVLYIILFYYIFAMFAVAIEISSHYSCYSWISQATGTFMFMSLDKHGEERRASKILLDGRGKLWECWVKNGEAWEFHAFLTCDVPLEPQTMQERLLIFSNNPGSKGADGGRAHAERMVNEMVQELGNTGTRQTWPSKSFLSPTPNINRIWQIFLSLWLLFFGSSLKRTHFPRGRKNSVAIPVAAAAATRARALDAETPERGNSKLEMSKCIHRIGGLKFEDILTFFPHIVYGCYSWKGGHLRDLKGWFWSCIWEKTLSPLPPYRCLAGTEAY